jgi:hypothetical protein
MHGLPVLIGSGIREVYRLVADATEDFCWLVIHGRMYTTTGSKSLLDGVTTLGFLPFSHRSFVHDLPSTSAPVSHNLALPQGAVWAFTSMLD